MKSFDNLLKNGVICDTNIWYQFAKGAIDENYIKNHKLIATFVNITELAQSSNMILKPQLFINTLKALKKYNTGVIKSNPFEHILDIFFNDFKPDHSLANRILSGFDTYMSIEPKLISKNDMNKALKEIEHVKIDRLSISDHVNAGLPEIRKNIKLRGGKKHRRKITTIDSWKKFISEIVLSYSKEFLKKEYRIELRDPSWTKFEFLLTTFENYFLELELSNNRKFDMNDWGDLINLVYVQPNKYYWTFDRNWSNLYKDNKEISKYFF